MVAVGDLDQLDRQAAAASYWPQPSTPRRSAGGASPWTSSTAGSRAPGPRPAGRYTSMAG